MQNYKMEDGEESTGFGSVVLGGILVGFCTLGILGAFVMITGCILRQTTPEKRMKHGELCFGWLVGNAIGSLPWAFILA